MLLGTGKIGRNTCKNLVDYLGTSNIILANRTEEKAIHLAEEMKLCYASMENIGDEIESADIIVVATNATEPVITRTQLESSQNKLIIDLSVPCNVAADALTLQKHTFVDVDQLSRIKDKTLEARQAEVPKALAIINEHLTAFITWCDMRRHVPVLKEVKHKLKELNQSGVLNTGTAELKIYGADPEEKIQKVLNAMAIKMRNAHTPGCQYIEAINDFIA